MADESQLKAVGRALLQAMRPGLGTAYMPSQQPTLPTPPGAGPIPNYAAGSVTGQPIPNAMPGEATAQPAYNAPYTGLRNTPAPQLPPYQGAALPGSSQLYSEYARNPGGGQMNLPPFQMPPIPQTPISAAPQLPPPPPGLPPLQAAPAAWQGLQLARLSKALEAALKVDAPIRIVRKNQ